MSSESLDDESENSCLNLLVDEIEKEHSLEPMTISDGLRLSLKDLKLPANVKPRGRPRKVGQTNTNTLRGGM